MSDSVRHAGLHEDGTFWDLWLAHKLFGETPPKCGVCKGWIGLEIYFGGFKPTEEGLKVVCGFGGCGAETLIEDAVVA